jgi:hypothetical protein
MDLTQKRKLTAALKALHGKRWTAKMRPIYDERQLPSIYLDSFHDLDLMREIARYPIYWMELVILKETSLDDVRGAIPLLLKGAAQSLEFLRIHYIFDLTAADNVKLRSVLPDSGEVFDDFPKIDRVVFDRVNFSDKHLESLCRNPTLRDVDIREGDVTNKILKPLSKMDSLEILRLDRCAAIPREMLESFQQELPRVRRIRIR